jgi:uncharacterized protein YijF (DUF1287 family)
MPCCALDYSSPPLRLRRVFALALLLPVSVFGHSLRVLPSQGRLVPPARPVLERFVAAAVERTHHIVRYDGSYVRIPYPGGDVPASTGVCTDEVIRAYRAVGIDLQKEVHIDMLNDLSAYPRRWPSASHASGPASTDTNIDHRRVANLMVFFPPSRRRLAAVRRRQRLSSGRYCHLEFAWRNYAHQNGGGSEIAAVRTLPRRAQHRPRTSDGGCTVRLENHRSLPVLRRRYRQPVASQEKRRVTLG